MNRLPAIIARRPAAAFLAVLTLAFLVAGPVVLAADTGLETGVKQQIDTISSDVAKKRAKLNDLTRQETQFRQAISEKKAESASLEDDIALFDNRIAQAQLDIEIAEGEISQLELEMQEIDVRVQSQEDRMARERRLLGTLARRLYRAQFRKTALDILLEGKSLSEFFDAIRRIADLESGLTKSLHEIQALRTALSEERQIRENKKVALGETQHRLASAKREIEDERSIKETLLTETKSSELEYRYRLAELKREQDDADTEIAALERKLREKADLADRLKGQNAVLSWPLVPARGLSTRYHDPDYPFRYVFEHPGIDVPAPQGTPVRASAAGVVGRAKDAGMGYNYVLLMHSGGVSTVYGHLSKITAKEDAFVERGEIIGYSGGRPGTPGAGTMTTGPHLHYETRLNGIPVDPMRYLVSMDLLQ